MRNWYDYGARFYNPQLAVFHSLDVKAEEFSYQSPYVYAANNPIKFIDYMGMSPGDPPTGSDWLSYAVNYVVDAVVDAATTAVVETAKAAVNYGVKETKETLNEHPVEAEASLNVTFGARVAGKIDLNKVGVGGDVNIVSANIAEFKASATSNAEGIKTNDPVIKGPSEGIDNLKNNSIPVTSGISGTIYAIGGGVKSNSTLVLIGNSRLNEQTEFSGGAMGVAGKHTKNNVTGTQTTSGGLELNATVGAGVVFELKASLSMPLKQRNKEL